MGLIKTMAGGLLYLIGFSLVFPPIWMVMVLPYLPDNLRESFFDFYLKFPGTTVFTIIITGFVLVMISDKISHNDWFHSSGNPRNAKIVKMLLVALLCLLPIAIGLEVLTAKP